MVESSGWNQMIHEVYVIDGGLKDIDDLVANLPSGATWYVLQPHENGVEQLAAILTNHQDLSAIHLFSHGSSGNLQLGSTLLDTANLDFYSSQLAIIGEALSGDGDLLLYGCNVAQGETGLVFINRLSEITGADVAASNDLTGSSQQGGDWTLENSTGSIESKEVEYSDESYGHALNVINTTLNFASLQHSMWGDAPGLAGTFTFDDLLWTADPAPITGEKNLIEEGILLPEVDLAYNFDIDNIEFGLLANFGLSLGVFDLAYPMSLQLFLPDQVKPGDEFDVGSSIVSVSNPSMVVDGPSLEANISLKASGELNGYANIMKDDEYLIGLNFDHEQLSGDITLFDINEVGIASGDLFAEFTAQHGWTDDILGGRKVFRTPYGSIGYDVDFNMFDGSSDSIGTVLGALPDLNVRLTQEEPLFWATADVDDILGGVLEMVPEPTTKAIGEAIRRLDMVYRNKALGTDIELGLLSVDFTVGFKPYIDISYDVQDITISLETSDGQTHTGSLGQTFSFDMPEHQTTPLALNTSYELISNVSYEFGLVLEGGFNIRLLSLEGEILGFDLPGLGEVSGALFDYTIPSDSDGSLSDWWDYTFAGGSWVDSLSLAGGSYNINVGPTTIGAIVPGEMAKLRVTLPSK